MAVANAAASSAALLSVAAKICKPALKCESADEANLHRSMMCEV